MLDSREQVRNVSILRPGISKPHAATLTRRTRISPSRFRVCAISYADCIRISVSIFTPNAFSIRSAISPESPALQLSRLESVGRDLPREVQTAMIESQNV